MNHHDKSFRKLTIRTMLILIFCTIIASGCALQSSQDFPFISYADASNTPTKAPAASESASAVSGTIKVALPISDECLKYLFLMYSGEKAGLFSDHDTGNTGLTVSLEALDSYVSDQNVELKAIPSTGYAPQELVLLAASDSLPDIMLINNADSMAIDGFSATAFDNAILDEYLSPSLIYPAMIQNGLSGTTLQSIPYYASIKMIYANLSLLLDENEVSLLPESVTLDFKTMTGLAKTITKTDTGLYGFMGLSELLAYFPMVFDSAVNSFMWNGKRFDYSLEAFSNSIYEMKELIAANSVVDTLTEKQMTAKYGSDDPRNLNKIGFWVDDSNRLETWESIIGSSFNRYAIQYGEKIAIPLSIYSIVVNLDSDLLDEVKAFSAYLAFDRDALLFRSRYTNPNGFIPPLRDEEVWKNLVRNQPQGRELYYFQDKMENAKSVTNNAETFAQKTFDSLYDSYFKEILNNRKNYAAVIEEINIEANKSLIGS